MTDRLEVGEIAGTHGIRGDVKVFPLTDNPKRFSKLKTVILNTRLGEKEVAVSGAKYIGKFVVVHLDGYNTPEEARLLRGLRLSIRREAAVQLPKGSWFIPDLIGMQVMEVEEDGTEEVLGTLTDVIRTAANDVYAVTTPEQKEILIPAIKDCILDVNVEEAVMKVHLLPGLKDL